MLHYEVYFEDRLLVCFTWLHVLGGVWPHRLPLVVHLGSLLPGRLMAILIQSDAQLAEVMLHRRRHFQWLDDRSTPLSAPWGGEGGVTVCLPPRPKRHGITSHPVGLSADVFCHRSVKIHIERWDEAPVRWSLNITLTSRGPSGYRHPQVHPSPTHHAQARRKVVWECSF